VTDDGSSLDPRNNMGIATGAYDGKWSDLYTGDTASLADGTWCKPTPGGADGFHSAYRRYGASKLCEVMSALELQERLSRDAALAGVGVLLVDPGAMSTSLMRRAGWLDRLKTSKRVMSLAAPLATWAQPNGPLRTTAKSAQDVLRAAFDKETLGERPRAVYLNGTDDWQPSKVAQNGELRKKLWADSVKMAGLAAGETALGEWQ
jgi:NAD(P)-dependent dehydrogenase (short-subunit alcohol dehydrogenase family)